MSGTQEYGAEPESRNQLAYALWFVAGRPDALRVDKALRSCDGNLSLRETAANGSTASWTIFSDEIPFEIHGLAPGAEAKVPNPPNHFDLREGGLEGAEAVLLFPKVAANDQIAVIEIVRRASQIALALLEAGQVIAVGWRPAGSGMSASYFERIVSDWLSGGPFPALGLASLSLDQEESLVSRGLAPLCGYEVAIPYDAKMETAQRARVAIRVMDHIVRHGEALQPGPVEIDGFGRFDVGIDEDGKKIYLFR